MNRMSELLTYGSVGGGGRKPASYPALDAGSPLGLHSGSHWCGGGEAECSANTSAKK